MLLMFFLNSQINMKFFQPAQSRLLSISSNFFKKEISISACFRLALSNLSSARNLSTSVSLSSFFLFPRLSCKASRPPASYFSYNCVPVGRKHHTLPQFLCNYGHGQHNTGQLQLAHQRLFFGLSS